MQDLITDETGEMSLRDSKCHMLTCNDSNSVVAPTIASHLGSYYSMKTRPVDDHGQNSFGKYRHIVEQEILDDELCDFLNISKHPINKKYHNRFEHHFKLALPASSYIIQERVDRASKYPKQNLVRKYFQKKILIYLIVSACILFLFL